MPIPSIASDRTLIVEQLHSSRPKMWDFAKIRRIAVGLRAEYRDSEWLHEQLAIAKGVQKSELNIVRDSLFSERIASLEGALKRMLEEEIRPTRIRGTALAAMAGLSGNQAGGAIRSHPPLREAINRANSDKIRRQLLWAARQLHAEGGRLSKKQLGKRAGLPTTAVVDDIFYEIHSLYFPTVR